MRYAVTLGNTRHAFGSLRELLAKATPRRSGDELAGVAANSAEERVAAQLCLADAPLADFLKYPLIPYEDDEVTRLILDTHDRAAFAPVADLSVGQFRDWLLRYETGAAALASLAPGLTPEMVAAVSKLMGNQDLILVASKIRVVTRFRNTLGLAGRLSVRVQPNHPTDAPPRHRRIHARRPALRLWRRRHRHQPRHRQRARGRNAPAPARRTDPPLRNPHAVLRARPRHHHAPVHRTRRAG